MYSAFIMALGYALFPVWFFQGIEEMKLITILTSMAKTLFSIFIFLFIKNVNQYIYVHFFESIGFVFAGIISLFLCYKKYNISYNVPKFKEIFFQLKRGWAQFWITVLPAVYSKANPIIIKFIKNNNEAVGVYSTAEKTLTAARMIFNPASRVLLPYTSRKVANKRLDYSLKRIYKLITLSIIFTIPISIIFFIFANQLQIILVGYINDDLTTILRIVSPLVTIGGINIFDGIIGLTSTGRERVFLKGILLSGITSLLLSFVLTYKLSAMGATISLLTSEAFLMIYLLLYLNKLKNEQDK